MLHILNGQPRHTAHTHATVAEARQCQAWEDDYDRSMDEPPSCPICDAWGCGGAYGRGCDRYERGTARQQWEADQEDWVAAQGGLPF